MSDPVRSYLMRKPIDAVRRVDHHRACAVCRTRCAGSDRDRRVKLRNTHPHLHRPFKVPLGGVFVRGTWIGTVPLLALIACVLMAGPIFIDIATKEPLHKSYRSHSASDPRSRRCAKAAIALLTAFTRLDLGAVVQALAQNEPRQTYAEAP